MLVTVRIFFQACAGNQPHVCNQQELDDLTRDVSFTKSHAYILTLPDKHNLYDPTRNIATYQKRQFGSV